MNHSARLSRRNTDIARPELDCEAVAARTGDGACQTVMLALCRREQEGERTTVWDLQEVTGLLLHEAFAALRTLEFGRLVHIADNPSDPFGSLITMRPSGIAQLESRKAG